MKTLLRTLFLFLCSFLAGYFCVSIAQTSRPENKGVEHKPVNSVNKDFLRTIRAKRQNSSFVLITPEDLSKISSKSSNALGIIQDPCDTALTITVGQTVNGQLSTSDCRLEDGSYADFYAFNGTQGQQITALMTSNAFDTYLGLANEDGSFLLEDDDGGGGTHSKIITTLPATGLYIILANSAFANKFGDYTLDLTNTFTACSFTFEPNQAQIPATGGTFTFNINTQPNCRWTTETNSPSQISTDSSATGSGTVIYTVTTNDSGSTRTMTITVAGRVFTITQPSLPCSFTLTPGSAAVGATISTNTFTVTAPPGCSWTATSSNFYIRTNSTGNGNGTVTYTILTNNGTDRTGTIVIRGQVFTITQPGLNCTYSISPLDIVVDRYNHNGTITVTTQPACTWDASAGYGFVQLQNAAGIGTGTFDYQIPATYSYITQTGFIAVYGLDLIARIRVTQTGVPFRTRFDFDGDSRADFSIFRPENGTWYQFNFMTGLSSVQFGISTDKLVPADYDNDRKTDIAVFRDGIWYLQKSYEGFAAIQFGIAGDVPIPGDLNGDGWTELVVFRPSNGTWYVLDLANNQFNAIQFGSAEDKSVAADYDGDSKLDYGVYRPSTGTWYLMQTTKGFEAMQFGLAEDKPVVGDYDGDGKADQAVFRPSNGVWYILNSRSGFTATHFGISTDKPVPADYDGDGKTDLAVYRDGNWFLLNSTTGFWAFRFGTATDRPVPNSFIP